MKEEIRRDPDVSTGVQPDGQSVDQRRGKREWRRPKLETLPLQDTLFGTSPGNDGGGFPSLAPSGPL